MAPLFQLFPSLDSTNAEAKRQLRDGALAEPSVIWTPHQTNGRGTRGRQWISPTGTGLTFSIVFPEGQIPRYCQLAPAGQLTTGIGHVLANYCQAAFNLPVAVKPINDLMLPTANKGTHTPELGKFGGILVESLIQGSTWQGLIIGIGINWWAAPTNIPREYPIAAACDYSPKLSDCQAEALIPPMANTVIEYCSTGASFSSARA